MMKDELKKLSINYMCLKTGGSYENLYQR